MLSNQCNSTTRFPYQAGCTFQLIEAWTPLCTSYVRPLLLDLLHDVFVVHALYHGVHFAVTHVSVTCVLPLKTYWLLLLTSMPVSSQVSENVQRIPLIADAEFFKKLEQTGWLPSASGVGHAPKLFARLRDHANILNHRPINHHGVPLPLMHEAFGKFVDIFKTGIPTHSDRNFAVDLCKVASEVHSDSLCPFIGLHTPVDALSKLFIHEQGTLTLSICF